MARYGQGKRRRPIQSFPAPDEVDINRIVKRLRGLDYRAEAVKLAWEEFTGFMPSVINADRRKREQVRDTAADTAILAPDVNARLPLPEPNERKVCIAQVNVNADTFRQLFELRLALLEEKVVRSDDSISKFLQIVVRELHEVKFKAAE